MSHNPPDRQSRAFQKSVQEIARGVVAVSPGLTMVSGAGGGGGSASGAGLPMALRRNPRSGHSHHAANRNPRELRMAASDTIHVASVDNPSVQSRSQIPVRNGVQASSAIRP